MNQEAKEHEHVNYPNYEAIDSDGLPKRSIPKPITFIFGGLLYLWALYITFSSIVELITLFNISIAAGLVLVLTPLGWIFFGPAIVAAWSAPSILIDFVQDIRNSWEYYIKLILGYIAAFVAPYLIYFVLMFVLGFALSAAGIV